MINQSKVTLFAIVACIAMTLHGLANAQTYQSYSLPWDPQPVPEWPGLRTILRADNQTSASFVDTHLRYIEFYDPARSSGSFGIADTEKGWMPGARVSVTTVGRGLGVRHMYFNLNGTWVNGSTVYWGGDPTSVDHDVIKSAELRIGALSPLGYGFALTSYAGVGVRQWTRSLQGTGGYHEVYTNDYVGGGLLFQDAVDSRLVLSLDSFFGSTFNTRMNASGIPGGAYPFTPESYQLGKRFMYRISGTVDYALTKHLHLRFGAEYNRFRFGESPLSPTLYYEPDSTSAVVTVDAGLGYGL